MKTRWYVWPCGAASFGDLNKPTQNNLLLNPRTDPVQGDPETEISLAYVMNQMDLTVMPALKYVEWV